MHVPGLRSPYAKVGRLVYFGRMLDKIRLHAAGKLPPADYAANLGKGFDGRCCSFLRVNYDELKAHVLSGDASDTQLLQWAEQRGGSRTDEECVMGQVALSTGPRGGMRWKEVKHYVSQVVTKGVSRLGVTPPGWPLRC